MPTEYGNRKAGQYAKSQANLQTLKIVNRCVVGAAAIGFAGGACLGVYLCVVLLRLSILPPLIAVNGLALSFCVVIGIMIWLIPRYLKGPLNNLFTERFRWLQGGEAEAFVALAMRLLSKDWHVFHNVEIRGLGDIDHVLVGPAGVFTISTKAHKGTYSLNGQGACVLNGSPTDELKEAQIMAVKLREWMSARSHRNQAIKELPWVQPVLVVPFARIEMSNRQQVAWIYDEERLADELEAMKRKIPQQMVEAYAGVIKEIAGVERYVPPAEYVAAKS